MKKKLAVILSVLVGISIVVTMLMTTLNAATSTHEAEASSNKLKYAKVSGNFVEFDEKKDAYVEMKEVNSSSSGNVTLTFYYSSSNSFPVEIKVNGDTIAKEEEFASASSGEKSFTANLNSGSDNKIRFKIRDAVSGIKLDKVVISTDGSSNPATVTEVSTETSVTELPTKTETPATPEPDNSNKLYAAPDGKSSSSGTSFSDAFDIKTALEKVEPGQTLLLESGTYKIKYTGSRTTFYLNKKGTSSKPIKIEGYNGQAKLDFQCPEGEWIQDSWGLEVSGDYYYIKNIDITRSAYHGVYVMGAYNTFENFNTYDNRTTGFEINKGGSYTTVIDCDSYNNYDPKRNGGMADGFASKQEQGKGNKFIGCNAWGNSDDGYDYYDSDYVVINENCTANNNGTHDGNGNGFKLGGNGAVAKHVLTDCTANNNRKHGFHANGNPGPITLINCTASGNGENDFNGVSNN